MKCPACSKNISEITVDDIKVDICQSGCHGIWLDNFELEKVDEAHESAGEKLLDFSPATQVIVDHSAKRQCPKCEGVTMQRFFSSTRKEVEIDDCPKCGGTWLDAGELARLRAEFKTQGERKDSAKQLFSELFDKDLAAEAAKGRAEQERAHKFARAFKYILPSYWIPGKQSWGAF